MTSATTAAPGTEPRTQILNKGKSKNELLDEIMDLTEDTRAVLGKRWGVPPSQIFPYGESFISLSKNSPPDFRIHPQIIVQFLSICKEHDLNPARYEVRAFYDYDKHLLQTFVMIDGWLTLANRNPQFDGVECEYEYDDQGKPVSVTSLVYRKDRSRPTKTRVKMSEWYVGTSPQWRMKPEWMLEQKAIKQGIRRAFGFAGIMDDDDILQIKHAEEVTGRKEPVKTSQGVKLSSLKPAEAPPEDEYSRPNENRPSTAGEGDTSESGVVPDEDANGLTDAPAVNSGSSPAENPQDEPANAPEVSPPDSDAGSSTPDLALIAEALCIELDSVEPPVSDLAASATIRSAGHRDMTVEIIRQARAGETMLTREHLEILHEKKGVQIKSILKLMGEE